MLLQQQPERLQFTQACSFILSCHAVLLNASLTTHLFFFFFSNHSLRDNATHGQQEVTAASAKLSKQSLFSQAAALTHLRAGNESRHALLSFFFSLPFICFSPHFQQIRSLHSMRLCVPSEQRAFQKTDSSSSDWRQAGRQG